MTQMSKQEVNQNQAIEREKLSTGQYKEVIQRKVVQYGWLFLRVSSFFKPLLYDIILKFLTRWDEGASVL